LGKTPQNTDHTVGRNPTGAAHHLTAFAGAFFGDGAGMNDAHVTGGSEVNEFVSPVQKQTAENLALVMIDFTTQGAKGNFHKMRQLPSIMY
jgi:hypothetical protein